MSKRFRKSRRCWFLLAVAGCDGSLPVGPPADNELDGAMAPAPFVFEADADPAVAALTFIETELLVQPFPGADRQTLLRLYKDSGGTLIDELADVDTAVLQVPAGELQVVAVKLLVSGFIETLQKNYLFTPDAAPNDPLFPRQDHFAQVRAAQAWDITVGASSIVIAVVDTGVNAEHEDLADKVVDGWNIYDGGVNFADVAGHGTQVAGVAGAASNNGMGVAGIAWNCPILAVRVGDPQGFSTSRHIAAGILWAAAHGARVINVSFAPLWSDRIIRSAVQQAFNRGCLVVISAGNAGGTNSAAGYDEALFVGAINPQNEIAAFSDRGPFIDLVAPGTGIRTTTRDGSYAMANGTSFAAPIVTGVAALAWSVAPDLRPASIQKVLLDTAVDWGPSGKDDLYGAGVVDASAVVAAAERAVPSTDMMPPTLRVIKPAQGEKLSGRFTVSADATDASGVADVALSIDGIALATDTRSPYQFVIDRNNFASGGHALALVATDSYGNASATRTVNVTFATPAASSTLSAGTITFRSPAPGAAVSGDVIISAGVSDADGLALVEWLIDGRSVLVSRLTGTSSGVSYSWRAMESTSGPHNITLILTDSTGMRTTATLVLNRS